MLGMFSFTGLKPEQVDALAEKAHIYLTRDGRISMAALNNNNVEVRIVILLCGRELTGSSTLPSRSRRLSRESSRRKGEKKYRSWGF